MSIIKKEPSPELLAAVEEVSKRHKYAIPFYRPDGMEASVQCQGELTSGRLGPIRVYNLMETDDGIRGESTVTSGHWNEVRL